MVRPARDLAGRQPPAQVVATELEFAAEVGRARLGGRVDRIERDADGRAVVVDLKTGTGKVPAAELPEHGQLAAYQLAVEAGAFDGVSESGGAELVQVGKAGGKDFAVQQQAPLAGDDDPGWARSAGARRRRGDGRLGVPGGGEPLLRHVPGAHQLPGAGRRPGGDRHDPGPHRARPAEPVRPGAAAAARC